MAIFKGNMGRVSEEIQLPFTKKGDDYVYTYNEEEGIMLDFPSKDDNATEQDSHKSKDDHSEVMEITNKSDSKSKSNSSNSSKSIGYGKERKNRELSNTSGKTKS